jgi:predicted nucleic acid-binding protein
LAASSASGGGRFLVDNSALARAPEVADEWAAALANDQLYAGSPFLLEALYSARDGKDYQALDFELGAGLTLVEADADTFRQALYAQRTLAEKAAFSHRVKPVDLLLAALAHQRGLGVLHYDVDYDRIAAGSGLQFESRWVAPRGSLVKESDDSLRPRLRLVTWQLGRFHGERGVEVLDRVLDLLAREAEADGLQPAAAPPAL